MKVFFDKNVPFFLPITSLPFAAFYKEQNEEGRPLRKMVRHSNREA